MKKEKGGGLRKELLKKGIGVCQDGKASSRSFGGIPVWTVKKREKMKKALKIGETDVQNPPCSVVIVHSLSFHCRIGKKKISKTQQERGRGGGKEDRKRNSYEGL